MNNVAKTMGVMSTVRVTVESLEEKQGEHFEVGVVAEVLEDLPVPGADQPDELTSDKAHLKVLLVVRLSLGDRPATVPFK